MNDSNAKIAHDLLFTDPETNEELCIDQFMTEKDKTNFSFIVRNRAGDRKWKHTIHTEEV